MKIDIDAMDVGGKTGHGMMMCMHCYAPSILMHKDGAFYFRPMTEDENDATREVQDRVRRWRFIDGTAHTFCRSRPLYILGPALFTGYWLGKPASLHTTRCCDRRRLGIWLLRRPISQKTPHLAVSRIYPACYRRFDAALHDDWSAFATTVRP